MRPKPRYQSNCIPSAKLYLTAIDFDSGRHLPSYEVHGGRSSAETYRTSAATDLATPDEEYPNPARAELCGSQNRKQWIQFLPPSQ
jgi:hypothetical protein